MEQKLLNIIEDVLDIEHGRLNLDSERKCIEEWDSLAHIQLIAMIEEEFDVNILLEEIDIINKISDFLKFIK